MAHIRVRALEVIDRAAAEQQARVLLDAAQAQHDYRVASAAATALIRYCRDEGRLAEARDLAGQNIRYIQKAQLGPWTRILGEVQRLRVQREMGGRARQVQAEVLRLRARMDRVPSTSKRPEITRPWNVKEALLDLAAGVADDLGHWQEALDLNTAVVAAKRARGAVSTDIAAARFNDYGPLISLRRLGDAQHVLRECQKVFEQDKDFRTLGSILIGQDDVEDKRGHG